MADRNRKFACRRHRGAAEDRDSRSMAADQQYITEKELDRGPILAAHRIR